jgi:NAD(P)-dependent dehydrogenase (short-subunit alcohol dehydrogenase family)
VGFESSSVLAIRDARGDEMDINFAGLGFRQGDAVVVTGAANGIGREVALLLARAGLTVSAWDIEESALNEVVTEIAATGAAATGVLVDLANQGAIDSAWNEAASMGHPIPYLVNNAGPPSTTELSVVEGLRLAVGSYVAVTEGWLKHCAAEASSMTFTSSVAGNFFVGPTPDWYPTAKAGIAGYMRHCAVKLRGRPRSNGVAPTGVVTRRTAEVFASEKMQERLRTTPMGRAGMADEVAAMICFLLSPAASFINGVLIPVDGASTWTHG